MISHMKKILASIAAVLFISLALTGCVGGSKVFSASADGGSSLDNPAPAGTTVRVEGVSYDFDVQFGEVVWNANPEISAENQFNTPPSEGYQFLMVNVSVRNNTDAEVMPTVLIYDVQLIAPDGSLSKKGYNVIPNDLLLAGDLAPGDSVSGNVAFEVPRDITSGTWLITIDGEEFYVTA